MNENVFHQFPVLESERLVLVRHSLDHIADMYALRTDKTVMKYLDTHPPKSMQDIEAKIEENISNFDNKVGVNWVITLKESNETIGYMGIWRIDKPNNRGEIGYALKKDHWNQGIATEAAKTIINFAFRKMELHTIKANVNPDNIASHHLLTKLGFKKEAHFRQDYFFDGKYLDSAIYGLLNEDWMN